jgi:hypothetical protein
MRCSMVGCLARAALFLCAACLATAIRGDETCPDLRTLDRVRRGWVPARVSERRCSRALRVRAFDVRRRANDDLALRRVRAVRFL